jgi:hypothetical protein
LSGRQEREVPTFRMHLSTVPAWFVRLMPAQTPPAAVRRMRWAEFYNSSSGTPDPSLFPPLVRVRLHQVRYRAELCARQFAVGNHQLPFGHRRDEIGDQAYPAFPRASVSHLLLLAHRKDAQRCAIFVLANCLWFRSLPHPYCMPGFSTTPSAARSQPSCSTSWRTTSASSLPCRSKQSFTTTCRRSGPWFWSSSSGDQRR